MAEDPASQAADGFLLRLLLDRPDPFAERLLFEVPPCGTEDLDESMISGAVLRRVARKQSIASPAQTPRNSVRQTVAPADAYLAGSPGMERATAPRQEAA